MGWLISECRSWKSPIVVSSIVVFSVVSVTFLFFVLLSGTLFLCAELPGNTFWTRFIKVCHDHYSPESKTNEWNGAATLLISPWVDKNSRPVFLFTSWVIEQHGLAEHKVWKETCSVHIFCGIVFWLKISWLLTLLCHDVTDRIPDSFGSRQTLSLDFPQWKIILLMGKSWRLRCFQQSKTKLQISENCWNCPLIVLVTVCQQHTATLPFIRDQNEKYLSCVNSCPKKEVGRQFKHDTIMKTLQAWAKPHNPLKSQWFRSAWSLRAFHFLKHGPMFDLFLVLTWLLVFSSDLLSITISFSCFCDFIECAWYFLGLVDHLLGTTPLGNGQWTPVC